VDRETFKEVIKESLAEMSGALSLCNLYLRKENVYEEKNCWSNYRIDIWFGTCMERSGVNKEILQEVYMNWISFGLGFAFGVLASVTVVYIILKSTAKWIKENGLPNTTKEKEEKIWDDIGRL
jgi:hypothetical protein